MLYETKANKKITNKLNKEKIKKIREKNSSKKEQGITLIALVTTIIVLLILAGVSIATLTGQNGILTRAQDAKTQTGVEGEKEEIQLAYAGAVAEKRGTGDVTASDLNREFGTNGTSATATDGANGTITVTFGAPSNRVYTIDADGNITGPGTSENPGGGQTGSVQPGEIVESTVKNNYTDSEGNKATVPAGFVVSKIPEEQKVSSGLVIYDIPEDELADVNWTTKNPDGAYQVQTLYNQFVWIPVGNDAEFIRYDGYYDGSYNEGFIDNCAEPDTTNGYATEEAEFNAMKESVLNYDGFYVGRYEASEESGKATSKQGKSVWNYIAWGDSMSSIGTEGAVYKAQQMYTDKNTYGVTSTLIYGVQWDAIMAWIDPAYKTGSCESTSFVRDSSGKGYYDADAPTTTGSSSAYAVNNIYDLAGNVAEWTMESGNSNLRVFRGGYCYYSGSLGPASRRYNRPPSLDISDYIGFRVTLYL